MRVKEVLRPFLPNNLYQFLRMLSKVSDLWGFTVDMTLRITMREKMWLLWRFYRTTCHVPCEHTHGEVLTFARRVLSMDTNIPGCIVEAGCFKGGGTAKFSLLAKLSGRTLLVFDSFEGIPANDEPHSTNIFGKPAGFHCGVYKGSREEVHDAVERFGEIGACVFYKGWFENTMQHLQTPVAVAYLDVDLVSSTRTCMRYLWPLVSVGGSLFSQDGHLPLVLKLLTDEAFWWEEFKIPLPRIHGLYERQLIRIDKEVRSSIDHSCAD